MFCIWIGVQVSGNMFCIILCVHRVWNPSLNLNPSLTVIISHKAVERVRWSILVRLTYIFALNVLKFLQMTLLKPQWNTVKRFLHRWLKKVGLEVKENVLLDFVQSNHFTDKYSYTATYIIYSISILFLESRTSITEELDEKKDEGWLWQSFLKWI